MNSDNWCKHYNGMMNKVCDAGVEYDSIKTAQDTYPLVAWHCTQLSAAVKCPKHQLRTKEEIEEAKKRIAAAFTRFASFMDGTSDVCPHCGATVESAEEIGRCVYARPCGCRVMQGELPDRWKR